MLITTESAVLDEIVDALLQAKAQLERLADRETELVQQVDQIRPMPESEACQYLGRDAVTLRFYRKTGLPYFKKGRDVWYTKADIDLWLSSGKVNRHSR